MAMDIAKIEERIDKTVTGSTAVNAEVCGIAFTTMTEVMEFAKTLATAGIALPPFLRGNPGTCFAVTLQAIEWRMSPLAVANKAYEVTNKGVSRVAYESQIIHAVIEARAPLKGRLRYEIIGEDDERRCKVWGTFKGEEEPHVFISETLGKLRNARGRNEYGNIKGSPLWDTQPEVQLFYSASRQWCRIYAPDVLAGIYSIEEMQDAGFTEVKDVTPPAAVRPSLGDRLKAKRIEHGSAFSVDRVAFDADTARVKDGPIIEGEVQFVGDAPSISPANDKKSADGEPVGDQALPETHTSSVTTPAADPQATTEITNTGAGDTAQQQSDSERVKRSSRSSSRKAKGDDADPAGN